MKKHFSFLFITCGMLYLLACNSAPTDKMAIGKDNPSFDLTKARTFIENENAKFVEEFKKGDSAGLASHYGQDAWLMMQGMEPIKKEGIEAAWGRVIRMGVKSVKVNTVDVVGNADLLAETGMFELYGDNNKLLDKGKYVDVWKPENGGWKIYRDIGNSNMPEQHK